MRGVVTVAFFYEVESAVDGVSRVVLVRRWRMGGTRRHRRRFPGEHTPSPLKNTGGSSAADRGVGAYASLRQKHGRHHHIAAKALTEDDRKRVQAYDESTKFQRPKVPEGASGDLGGREMNRSEPRTPPSSPNARSIGKKKKAEKWRREDSSSESSDCFSSDERRAMTTGRGATPSSRRMFSRGARAAKTDPHTICECRP